jgi:hypothetical protein
MVVQAPPIGEQFNVRVDGQVKRSFNSLEDATKFASAIKNAYPIVTVSVTDEKAGKTYPVAGGKTSG